MSKIAIKVENLGKQYKIGGEIDRYRTLRDSIADAFRFPAKLARGELRARSNNTIWAGFDTIRADGLRCPIDQIWRLEDRESYPITN